VIEAEERHGHIYILERSFLNLCEGWIEKENGIDVEKSVALIEEKRLRKLENFYAE